MAPTTQTRSISSPSAERISENSIRTPVELSRSKFLSVAIVFALGSCNTYYLPHVIAQSGMVFVIQFIVCYILAAVPMLYLEIALGQFTSTSPWLAYEMMSPSMAGIPAIFGFNIILRIVISTAPIAHAILLFINSLRGAVMNLPWAECTDFFECYDVRLAEQCTFESPNKTQCTAFIEALVIRRSSHLKDTPLVSFLNSILKEEEPLNVKSFLPHPCLFAALLIVWVIITIGQNGGMHLFSKISYIVILIAAISTAMNIIAAVTLGEVDEAASHFFKTRYANLLRTEDWIVAAGYALLTLNVSSGGMIKLASSRSFRLPIFRDVIIIALVTLIFHALTLIAFIAILDVYGDGIYRYDEHDARFSYVTERCFLAVATVAEVFVGIPGDWFLNALYFLGVAVMPLQTMATHLWVLKSMFHEKYEETLQKRLGHYHVNILTILIVILGFIVNIPFIIPGGFERSQFIQKAIFETTLFIGLLQLVTVSYIYGFRRFSVNIRTMVGGYGPVNFFWWFNWTVISPFLLLFETWYEHIDCICELLKWLRELQDWLYAAMNLCILNATLRNVSVFWSLSIHP